MHVKYIEVQLTLRHTVFVFGPLTWPARMIIENPCARVLIPHCINLQMEKVDASYEWTE